VEKNTPPIYPAERVTWPTISFQVYQLPGAFLREVSNGPVMALIRRGVLLARSFGSFAGSWIASLV